MKAATLKAVAGDFRFVEGSLREKVYNRVYRARNHQCAVETLKKEFAKEPELIGAIRVLRMRGQVK